MKSMPLNAARRGFTLIELMVAVATGMVLVLALPASWPCPRRLRRRDPARTITTFGV